jgi:hypothetical protein
LNFASNKKGRRCCQEFHRLAVGHSGQADAVVALVHALFTPVGSKTIHVRTFMQVSYPGMKFRAYVLSFVPT